MAIEITSPIKGHTGASSFGPLTLSFVDGVATVDSLSKGHRAYLKGAGYKIGKDSAEKTEPNSGAPELFDPNQHSVEEVVAYLSGANPKYPPITVEEWDRVKAAEAAGKNRATIANHQAVNAEGGDPQ